MMEQKHDINAILRGEKKEEYFMLEVQDDGMAPHLIRNDIVVCHRQSAVENGKLAAVIIDNSPHVTLRRFYQADKGIILTNENDDALILSGNEAERVQVLGAFLYLIRRYIGDSEAAA